MIKKYPAAAIANYFIRRSNEGPHDHNLTKMKLQKLVYFAHGVCLALNEIPLINESIEAWRYGPVIRSLHDYLRHEKTNVVVDLIKDGYKNEFKVDDEEVIKFLDGIRESTFNLTGIQLANWTHEKDSPWDQTYNSPGGDTGYATIEDKKISDYFKGQLHNED